MKNKSDHEEYTVLKVIIACTINLIKIRLVILLLYKMLFIAYLILIRLHVPFASPLTPIPPLNHTWKDY